MVDATVQKPPKVVDKSKLNRVAAPKAPPIPPAGQGFANAKSAAEKRYSATLNLPETAFDIRANAEKREILWRKRTTEDLYRWQVSWTA